MSKNITPRWEWRLFDNDVVAAVNHLQHFECSHYKYSEEMYLLSRIYDHIIKIREHLLEVKVRTAVNTFGLEQWRPVRKLSVPLDKSDLVKLFTYLGVPVVDSLRLPTDWASFLEFLVSRKRFVQQVKITKHRQFYVVNECIVELVKVDFNNQIHETICVEHSEPERVAATVCQLGLEQGVNKNYVIALKEWLNS